MSKIAKGTHPLVLEELTGRIDGTTAYRYSGVVSESPDTELSTNSDVEWTCAPDTDDLDLDPGFSMSPGLLAALVLRAREHCPTCTGCTRA